MVIMLIGLLRTILIIIGVYYLVKFIMWLFKSPEQPSRSTTSEQSHKKKKEGEVTIDYMPDNKKHIRKDSGDYIDYEEVKEE